jgi:hypothetical protein
MKRLFYEYTKREGIISDDKISAKNSIEIKNNSVIISGNTKGLVLLIDYFIEIALNDEDNHIHLDESNFFDKAEVELIIEKNSNLNSAVKNSIVNQKDMVYKYLEQEGMLKKVIGKQSIINLFLEGNNATLIGNDLGLIMMADHIARVAIDKNIVELCLDKENCFNESKITMSIINQESNKL